MKIKISDPIGKVPERLLSWYDKHKRTLPWRPKDGSRPDPYKVWLSEIMLQQTQVVTATPYFEKFLILWPCVTKLAEADLDDIFVEWAGLGYYARARNLHKCANIVATTLDGVFPDNELELIKLPGIGTYTAAAIVAIAFDLKATPMDGNFDRVMARLHAIETPLPTAKPALKSLATKITPDVRPGDYAQAVMDLGATICTPRNPQCLSCPVNACCLSLKRGKTTLIPKKKVKQRKPARYGMAFLCINDKKEVLLRRRPNSGLFAGMMEIPGTSWTDRLPNSLQIEASQPTKDTRTHIQGTVLHVFTHFKLEIKVVRADINKSIKIDGLSWHPLESIDKAGIPSLMLKITKHGLA